jgi:cysteine desulfuration protein SufE
MSDIAARQAEIVAELAGLPDWKERYRRIIEIGKALPPLADEHKREDNLIKGCQNRVWLHARLDGDRVVFEADSEAQIVRGLVALLVRAYSDATPDEIIEAAPTFVHELGLGDNLTMNRVNGLASMIKQMKLYALGYKAILSRR